MNALTGCQEEKKDKVLNDIQRLLEARGTLWALHSKLARGDSMERREVSLGGAISLQNILEPMGYAVHCSRAAPTGAGEVWWSVEVQIDEGKHG